MSVFQWGIDEATPIINNGFVTYCIGEESLMHDDNKVVNTLVAKDYRGTVLGRVVVSRETHEHFLRFHRALNDQTALYFRNYDATLNKLLTSIEEGAEAKVAQAEDRVHLAKNQLFDATLALQYAKREAEQASEQPKSKKRTTGDKKKKNKKTRKADC